MKNNLEKLVRKGGEPEVLRWLQESGLLDPAGSGSCAERVQNRTSASEALRKAAQYGYQEIVEMLIPVSDPKAGTSEALRLAAKNGHQEIVETLLPVSDPLALGSQALRLAAANGHKGIVEILIPVSDPKAGNSVALRLAAHNGYKEIVEMLLPVSDASAPDAFGREAIGLAREGGFMEIAGLIESYAMARQERSALDGAVEGRVMEKGREPKRVKRV